MGLKVNGVVITTTQSFPITGSFDVYQLSTLQVRLNAGVNSISQIAVSDHGLSRVDQMIVTPATASSPSGPTNLRATPGNASATLTWNASASGNPTSYSIFRGTKSDGEVNTPVGTTSGSTTTFTDTGLQNGQQYFYFVAANNAVGGSPNSNEVTVTPVNTGAAPPTPSGVTALAGQRFRPAHLERQRRRHRLQRLPWHHPRRPGHNPDRHPHHQQLHRHRRHQRHHLLLQGHRAQRRWRFTALGRSHRHPNQRRRCRPAVPGPPGHGIVHREREPRSRERL